jgi:hypothetical protein
MSSNEKSILDPRVFRDWNKAGDNKLSLRNEIVGINEYRQVAEAFSNVVNTGYREGRWKIQTRIVDGGYDAPFIRYLDDEGDPYLLHSGYAGMYVDELPTWLGINEQKELLRGLSKTLGENEYGCITATLAKEQPSIFYDLLSDGCAVVTTNAIVIPTNDKSASGTWDTMSGGDAASRRKKKWKVKHGVSQALDAGWKVTSTVGFPFAEIPKALYDGWLRNWHSRLAVAKDADDLRHGIWVMQACIAFLTSANFDRRRLVTTVVRDSAENVVSFSLATCSRPGWLTFSHLMTNPDFDKPRASYLLFESLFAFAQDNGIEYIDLGDAEATQEDPVMAYKSHYRICTPPHIEEISVQMYNDPYFLDDAQKPQGFHNGRIIRAGETL